jgi:hypothetical protein
MPSELDIYRTAQVLVQQHAAGARAEALRRAEEMAELGDTDGAAVWRLVATAAGELLRQAGTLH